MTALGGLVDFGGRLEPASACEALLQAQSVFGPRRAHIWAGKGAALGQRLFPTLPEDRFDPGVAIGAGGNLVLAADVRLDDRQGLATAMGVDRERAAGLSDSELLLKALEIWGEAAVDRLIGVFAFALWDRRSRELLLARDFQGHRPLHFHSGAGFFAFASMPRGLHALEGVERRASRSAAAGFLSGRWPGEEETFFDGIGRVPQGHVMIVGVNGTRLRRWWNPPRGPLRFSSRAECQEAARELLDRAVAAQLRGAGEAVATQLSAGLDSSAVTGTAARLMQGRGKILAFTSVPMPGTWDAPPSRIVDESQLAASTAAMHPNITHFKVQSTGSALDSLPRNLSLWERPMHNLCNEGWVAAIHERAREQGAKVLLIGAAGNLTISHHGLELMPELLGSGRLWRLAREAAKLRRKGGGRWAGVALQALAPYLPPSILLAADRRRGVSPDDEFPSFLTAGAAETADRQRPGAAERRPPRNGFDPRLDVLRRADQGNINKGVLAGWGLDQRDPTADRRVVEFALSLPSDQFLIDGEQRALARQAFADRVPENVRVEVRKGYQAADWHARLADDRGRLLEEIEAIGNSVAAQTVDAAAMRRAVESWPDSGWGSWKLYGTYRHGLLNALSAGHFLRSVAEAPVQPRSAMPVVAEGASA